MSKRDMRAGTPKPQSSETCSVDKKSWERGVEEAAKEKK